MRLCFFSKSIIFIKNLEIINSKGGQQKKCCQDLFYV